MAVPEIRYLVPSAEVFETVLRAELPAGLSSDPPRRLFHRDLYFDTEERALRARGVTCRLRYRSDDRRFLLLRVRDLADSVVTTASLATEEEVHEADIPEILAGASSPARRLRAIVDPAELSTVLSLETERYVRLSRKGLVRGPRFEFVYDATTVRDGEAFDTFREIRIKRLRPGGPSFESLGHALQDQYGLQSLLETKMERAERSLRQLDGSALARSVAGSRGVAVLALQEGCIALRESANGFEIPTAVGSGEETCRQLMRDVFGTAEGRTRLLGRAPASATRPLLEVWVAEEGAAAWRSAQNDRDVRWVTLADVLARIGSPVLRDPGTLAALAVAARSDVLALESPADASAPDRPVASSDASARLRALPSPSLAVDSTVPEHFVNEQLSWIEFNGRVLALAEDPGTPLLARLMFLSIFSSNLDEFFMVRVGMLKHAIAKGVTKPSVDGLTPAEELDAITIKLAPLVARQQRVFGRRCRPDLAKRGIHIREWAELSVEEQTEMHRFFEEQIFPVLTPQAMTQAPGHPFPHIANLSLSLAVMVKDGGDDGATHFAHVKIPAGVRRFVSLPSDAGFVLVEDIISHCLHMLYPGRTLLAVHPFRVTRSGDIAVEEEATSSLLAAVEREVKRRPYGAVVRVEVSRDMPPAMRDFLRRELSFEETQSTDRIHESDMIEVDGPVDLGSLKELAGLPFPDLQYPPFEPRHPIDAQRSMFDIIRDRDVLVQHPYDAFEGTVGRFITEAAHDPDVLAIKLTLYRSGSQSAIVEALMDAARSGKDVSVFVELKARFDEERNIAWARRLEQAGIHVVTGLVKLKTHAKTTLVVRREGAAVRRYVHIGTGNYNSSTATLYTDFGLFTCNEAIGADLHNLFNAFTGTSEAPLGPFSQLLVAPKHMLDQFMALIDRETGHARAGRGGRIRAKLNGLADPDVIMALYRASEAGVEIDLIIRGICALRPGVPGLSERVRVSSIVGRFLEHARVYHFGNGGDDEYFIGSADWRPRNLRRRVEVVTPVRDAAARRRLNNILELELDDPLAWHMRSDGGYERSSPPVGVERISAQDRLSDPGGVQPTT